MTLCQVLKRLFAVLSAPLVNMPKRKTVSTGSTISKSSRLQKKQAAPASKSKSAVRPSSEVTTPLIVAFDDAQGPEEPAKERTKRGERRGQILEVAARLFAERGYATCDMSAIAAELQIAKGTVYLYFKSKEELFLSAIESGIARMQAEIQSVSRNAKGLAYISQVVEAYLGFFDRNPQVVELFVQEHAVFNRPTRPRYFEFRDANRSKWRDVYLALIESGLIRNDIPIDAMLDTVGALLYGAIFTNYLAGRKSSREEQTQVILAILFHGIAVSDKPS